MNFFAKNCIQIARRLLWLVLFLGLFSFAFKNAHDWPLHLWGMTDIEAPTIVILLVTFLLGWICHAGVLLWMRRMNTKVVE